MGGELLAEYATTLSAASPQKEYGYRNGQLLVTADAPPPAPNGYAYQRTLTIDHSKVPNTDQSNFPVLISGTYSYLATTAHGGNVQNANGYDVIFTSDSGCASKLNHEVESYNATSGAVNYWVKVPTVSHTSDTTIYICYGNSSIATDQSNQTGVWDANFKGVYHLGAGSTLNSNDSTANANNGTASGVSAVTGQISGGASFDGSTSKIDLASGSSFDSCTAMTLSAWVRFTAVGHHMFGKWQASADRSWLLSNDGASEVAVAVENPNTGISLWYSSGAGLTTGVWYHIEATWSQPNTVKIYVNGVSQSLATIIDQGVTTTGISAAHAMLGQDSDGLNKFNGLLDEARVSNLARSADWIATEYNNQSSPATFYTVSSATGGVASAQVQWLVTDQLGTPRMIFDQTGALANVKRHDYLPFGEELFNETRSTGNGTRLPQTSPATGLVTSAKSRFVQQNGLA